MLVFALILRSLTPLLTQVFRGKSLLEEEKIKQLRIS